MRRQQLHREVFNCPGCSDFTCVTHTTALTFQLDFEEWQHWTVRHCLGPKCGCGDAFNPYVCAGGSDHAGKVRCKTCKKIFTGCPIFGHRLRNLPGLSASRTP